MSKNMLRNQAFLRDSLEVISDWRLLTFCSVLLLRNTVLMFQKNLQFARFSLAMTVPFPNTLLCSNQMNKREYLGMICKSSFVSAN